MKQITGASIILTEACNLSCSYCYEKQKSPKVMDIHTAFNSVEFLFNNSNGAKSLSIIWFGGEPLLNFEVLLPASIHAMKLAEKRGVTLDQLIITNGTIWNDEIECFLQANPHIRLQLSWDGMPEFQDAERGKSYLLETTLERMKKLPNKLCAHVQVTPKMSSRLLENMDYIASKMGDKLNVVFRPVAEIEGWLNEGVLEKYREQQALTYDKYGDKIEKIANCEHAVQSNGICGAGKLFGSFTPDGDIYACHRFYFSKNRDFKVGNIYDGFLDTAKTDLLEDYERDNIVGCTECDAYELCDRCIAANYGENHDVLLPSDSHCEVSRSVFYSVFDYNRKHRPWMLAYQPQPVAYVAELPEGMTEREALLQLVFPMIAEKEEMINFLADQVMKLEAKVKYLEKSRGTK